MSTLQGRSKSALLIVDVQVGVMAEVHDRDGVVSRISSLVERSRAEGVDVIWVQHGDSELVEGSTEWQLVDSLRPLPGEPIVRKSYNDAFEETNLESELATRGVSRLVVAGAQTEWCIRSTLHGAIARGYDVVLVGDAHTTQNMSAEIPATSIIEITNRTWMWHSVPGRVTGVAQAAAVPLQTTTVR